MNKRQKNVLFATAIMLGLMLLFPPFHLIQGTVEQHAGYSFILSPPKAGLFRATLDATALIGQCLVVALMGIIVSFALKDYKSNG